MSLFDKAKKAVQDNPAIRDKAEELAEKAVDAVDQKTGGKVPGAVRDAVDKIDGKEG